MAKSPKNDRIYLRINDVKKLRMEEYAARHETSVSDIVDRYFDALLLKEDEEVRLKAEKKFF